MFAPSMRPLRNDDPRFEIGQLMFRDSYVSRELGGAPDVYFDALTSTAPCKRQNAEKAICALYGHMGERSPTIIWAPSPVVGLQLAIISAWCLATASQRLPFQLSPGARQEWIRRMAKTMTQASLSERVHSSEYRVRSQGRAPSARLTNIIMRACRAEIQTQLNKSGRKRNNWLYALKLFCQSAGAYSSYGHSLNLFRELLPTADFLYFLDATVLSFSFAGSTDMIESETARNRDQDMSLLFNFGHYETLSMPLPGEILDDSFKAERHRLQLAAQTVLECGIWWPLKDIAVVCERPAEIHVEPTGHLHSQTRCAMRYADGFEFYAMRGVFVPPKIARGNVSARDIDDQQNIELRRSMIEVYGLVDYLRDSHAKVIHRDEFGTLYRKEQDEDEPIVMVEVENKTPEADGTYRKYFLRVPPTIWTAHAAVAWTFGMSRSEYAPKQES